MYVILVVMIPTRCVFSILLRNNGWKSVVMEIAPGEPVPPGFEDEVKARAEIQTKIDKCKNTPFIGLEYLLELSLGDDKEPGYLCVLCEKRGDPRTIMDHMTSYKHRLKYLVKHFYSISFYLFLTCSMFMFRLVSLVLYFCWNFERKKRVEKLLILRSTPFFFPSTDFFLIFIWNVVIAVLNKNKCLMFLLFIRKKNRDAWQKKQKYVINKINWYWLIDQLICTRAHTFWMDTKLLTKKNEQKKFNTKSRNRKNIFRP